jgi:nucleotide-binding universal stress UspA family protein
VTLRSILSPVDFSEQSRHALRWAGGLAARFEARLTLLSVVDPLLAEAARIRLGQDLATVETEPALREFVAATWPDRSAPPVPTAFKTSIGDPAAAILEAATSEAVDLIVMGTQGLGGFRKWLVGSTTERLLRRTQVPVLAVPPADESGPPQVSDTLDLRQILAATDFSDSSVAAVRYAAELARRLSATLSLVHIVEPLTVPLQWRPLVEASDDKRVLDARERLEKLAQQYCGAQACDPIVSIGRPGDLIGSTADARRAQLIVMGLNGDQGPLSRRPGSIAYRVLSSTSVPVLVVPAGATLAHERGADA